MNLLYVVSNGRQGRGSLDLLRLISKTNPMDSFPVVEPPQLYTVAKELFTAVNMGRVIYFLKYAQVVAEKYGVVATVYTVKHILEQIGILFFLRNSVFRQMFCRH